MSACSWLQESESLHNRIFNSPTSITLIFLHRINKIHACGYRITSSQFHTQNNKSQIHVICSENVIWACQNVLEMIFYYIFEIFVIRTAQRIVLSITLLNGWKPRDFQTWSRYRYYWWVTRCDMKALRIGPAYVLYKHVLVTSQFALTD